MTSPSLERRFEIVRRGGADGGEDRFLAILEALGDNGFGQSVALAQSLFDLRIGAARRDDGDADDSFLLGPLQQARHRRLGDVQLLRNLSLLELVLVIEVGDARDHSKLVRSAHDRGPATGELRLDCSVSNKYSRERDVQRSASGSSSGPHPVRASCARILCRAALDASTKECA